MGMLLGSSKWADDDDYGYTFSSDNKENKMIYRPYLSVDTETTGLGAKAEILQIAGVIDDGISDIDNLTTFNSKLKYYKFDYAEPFALNMNKGLIEGMINPDTKEDYVSPKKALVTLIDVMHQTQKMCKEFDDANGLRLKGKVMFAGKNFDSFDKPKLIQCFKKHAPELIDEFIHMTSYKSLDPGQMYYTDFGYNASLSQINELTGRPAVTHDALDDAFDVVYAIRNKRN